jgi:hypothetical protein
MRKSLRFSALLMGSIILTSSAHSQSDRFTYAITDVNKDGANWSFLRKLNLVDGRFSDVLLNGTDAAQVAFDAATKKQITTFTTEVNRGSSNQPAFSTGVAAMAFDRKNNRIWYTPMFIDQLRYIDLKSMKVFYVTTEGFSGAAKKNADQGNIITRMTIAGDGNGYALTNDGASLIRFTTGKKMTITNLGMLVDDPAGKGGASIHSSCTSFGGDMVADNDGNLYVFSARNHIFKVNIETKVATHVGTVSGLPANFTTNGAAVTTENQILISSAVDAKSFYVVDPQTWAATSYGAADAWRSSDLANSNILNTTKPVTSPELPALRPMPVQPDAKQVVSVFPNPVSNNQFSIQFNSIEPGTYTVQITDVMGRQVMQRIVNVKGEDQVETIRLNPASAKGFYMVAIIGKENKAISTTKLVVQ